jgi:hypothetical protein
MHGPGTASGPVTAVSSRVISRGLELAMNGSLLAYALRKRSARAT